MEYISDNETCNQLEESREDTDSDIIEESDYEGEVHPEYLQWENTDDPNLEHNEVESNDLPRANLINLEPDFQQEEEEKEEDEQEEEQEEDEVEVLMDIKGQVCH